MPPCLCGSACEASPLLLPLRPRRRRVAGRRLCRRPALHRPRDGTADPLHRTGARVHGPRRARHAHEPAGRRQGRLRVEAVDRRPVLVVRSPDHRRLLDDRTARHHGRERRRRSSARSTAAASTSSTTRTARCCATSSVRRRACSASRHRNPASTARPRSSRAGSCSTAPPSTRPTPTARPLPA